ncbi:MAG: hypothetical protein K6A40_09410 [Solobacterium sp.]|nr:hypothetical protein [Solobacterium sp.]
MSEIRWNETFLADVPEGFIEADEAMKQQMNTPWGAPQYLLQDPDRHMIISLASRQTGGLTALLAGNVEEVVRNMEPKVAKAMQSFGYRQGSFLERTVADTKAYGFSYEYTAQNTGMSSETYMMKNEKTYYYFHVYYRTELKDESLPVWNAVLDSMRRI